MAIKVSGTTVIDDTRKGTFQRCNPGTYTNSNRPNSPNTGDIIYNTEEEALQNYNGAEWVSVGGIEVVGGNDTSPPVGSSQTGPLRIDSPIPGETIGRTGWVITWSVPSGATGDGTITVFKANDASIAYSTVITTSETEHSIPGDIDFGPFNPFVIQIVYPGAVGVDYAGLIAVETNNQSDFRLPAGDTYTSPGEYIIPANTTATDISIAMIWGSSGGTALSYRPGNDGNAPAGGGGNGNVKHVRMPIAYAKANYPGSSPDSINVEHIQNAAIFNDASYPSTLVSSGGGAGGRWDGIGSQSGTNFAPISTLNTDFPVYVFTNAASGGGGGRKCSGFCGNGGGGGAGGVGITTNPSYANTPEPKTVSSANWGGDGGDIGGRQGGYGGAPGSGYGGGGGGGGSGGEQDGSIGSPGGGGAGAEAITIVAEVIAPTAYLAIPAS